MLNGGSILHDGPYVDHVLAVLVDRSAQKTHESLVDHDLLGDGVYKKTGVYKGLAGALTLDSALGEFHERLSARSLGANPPLNFAH